MRLRFVHAARAAFEATQASGPGAVRARDDAPERGEFDDCLVAFLGVEGADAGDVSGVVAGAADAVRTQAADLNTTRVLLVPDPNLVEGAGEPSVTLSVVEGLADALADADVLRAPVGHRVALDLAAKGHPIADVTRRVEPGAGEREERGPSDRWVATADGERRDPEGADLPDALAEGHEHETGYRSSGADPLARLSDAGLATQEPLSPRGHARWLPRGVVVRETLAAFARERLEAAGASPVGTPLVYDLGERAVGECAGAWPAAYEARAGDERALVRPDVAVGLLSALADAVGSEADLPVRLAASGPAATAGGTGTRPAMATAALPERAREAFERQVRATVAACEGLGVADAVVCRFSPAGPVDEAWVDSLATALDRPVLVERRPDERPERAVECAVVAVTGLDAPLELGTVALDTASAGRFDVEYEAADGEPRRPAVVRCAPVGGLGDALAAVLARRGERDGPPLPTWLAPTQVRLVPLADEHAERCDDLVAALDGVRVDVDDRELATGVRLDGAAAEGVPFVAVVGDREADGAPLKVTDAAAGTEREVSVGELRARVASAVGDRPRPDVEVPTRLADRPRFEEAPDSQR